MARYRLVKWCDECQTPVEPVRRRIELGPVGGQGRERAALGPEIEECPNDDGTGTRHFLIDDYPAT
jgi:hypothetical protein